MGYIIFCILLVAAGIFLVYNFVRNLMLRTRLTNTGKRTNATIVGIQTMPGYRGSTQCHPVLSYTVDGVKHTIIYQFASLRRKSYKLSQIVEIAYKDDSPKDVVMIRETSTVVVSIFAILLGLFAIFAGTLGFIDLIR